MRQGKKKSNYPLNVVLLVLIVCVIMGGLILLGLPALERSASTEYNSRRKNDMAVLANAITQYRESNIGKFPTDVNAFKRNYITRGDYDFVDPDGVEYTIIFTNLSEGETESLPNQSYTMYVITNAVCDDNSSSAKYDANKKNAVILYHPDRSNTMCSEL